MFRRVVRLSAAPVVAKGWIVADSRYLLEVNGSRVQWGPAPCDPRWAEADPIDLGDVLREGDNAIGATVLFYGHGDGTWPFGRPGFLFWLCLEYADGRRETLVSDSSWQVHLCRAWQPGRYPRWYLRALQEQFDARLYPYGWSDAGFVPTADWLDSMPLEGSSQRPSICTSYPDYQTESEQGPAYATLRARSIPLLEEQLVPAKQLAESMWLKWRRPPEMYFENRTPDCFEVDRLPSARAVQGDHWIVELRPGEAALLTFELTEQMVGFPYLIVSAAEGTIIDLLTQEAHEVGGPALLYSTKNYAWTRFICRTGKNRFECFDYESLRWMQLHIQGAGKIEVHSVGVRRRLFPWKNEPVIRCDDPDLQRLFSATLNSLCNAASDQFVDGAGRERQQYAGDCGHQVTTSLLVFGDARLPARYLETWSQGLLKDGYFLDCWPGRDRLTRVAQREMDMSSFGPILDHGVQFGFDAWNHFLYTGDLAPLREPYPRLLKFANYLVGLIGRDDGGLLPVSNLGIPCVWLDHTAYSFEAQREKQCSFNLYVAAMFEHALAPMCVAFGDDSIARQLTRIARDLLRQTVKRFWSLEHRLFVDNLPWAGKEEGYRLSDLTLARAILFDQCPNRDVAPSVEALVRCPSTMGLSYPANAIWRLWALGKTGRIDVVLKELRTRWAQLPSVRLNNTVSEFWDAPADSDSQWSHAAVAALSMAHLCITGLRPLAPGFTRAELRPQLGDLQEFEIASHTPHGPVQFKVSGRKGRRQMTIAIPEGCAGELILRSEEMVALQAAVSPAPSGCRRYVLPSGRPQTLSLVAT